MAAPPEVWDGDMAVMAAVMDITMVIPTAGPVYSADYFSAGDMVITTTRMSAM